MWRNSRARWYAISSLAALVVLLGTTDFGTAFLQDTPPHTVSEAPATQPGETQAAEHGAVQPPEAEHSESESARHEIFHWINFFLIVAGAVYLGKKYLAPFLDQRAQSIREEMERSARSLEESSRRLTGIDEKLKQLDTEIGTLRRSALQEAAAEHERIEQQARTDANKILQMAEQEISAATKAARQELKVYTATLAIELAQKRIQGMISPEVDKRICRSFVQDLGQDSGRSRDRHSSDSGPLPGGDLPLEKGG